MIVLVCVCVCVSHNAEVVGKEGVATNVGGMATNVLQQPYAES